MQQVIDVLGFALLGAGFLMPLFALALVVMHFFMPKAVVERYWKSEHFSDFYLGAFTGTLSAPIRTAMLLAAIAVPSIARKRMMSDVLSFTPPWCRRTAKTFVAVWFVLTCAMVVPGLILMIHSAWEDHLAVAAGTHERDWKSLMALIVVTACWGGLVVRAAISHLRSRRPKARPARRSSVSHR